MPADTPLSEARADELAEARATIRRLNRRVQSAEAGLAAKMESGPCFGRALANAAATMYKAKLDEMTTDHARLSKRVEELTKSLERIIALARRSDEEGLYKPALRSCALIARATLTPESHA